MSLERIMNWHQREAKRLHRKLDRAKFHWEREAVLKEMNDHIKYFNAVAGTYMPREFKEKKHIIIGFAPKPFNAEDEPFLDKTLLECNKYLLADKGFEKVKVSPYGRSGSSWYWVKRRENEGLEHAFFCKLLKQLIQPHAEVELYYAVKPDVVFWNKGKKYCIEVETGSMLKRHPHLLEKRFRGIRREYSDFYILVLDKRYRNRYMGFGKAITRYDIKKVLSHLLSTHI